VTNVPDYCIDEVSNQAVCLMMALNRKIIPIDRAVRDKHVLLVPPNREAVVNYGYPVYRLQEQTLGIIGFGKIGTAVGLKAKGLGMRVIAYDPYVFAAVISAHGVEPVDFETLLCESDYISVNATLNHETTGLIGYEEFKRMKPNCCLINTARGAIVDHSAMVRAFDEEIIAGAGLDVTAVEPLPENDPIFEAPNVILTGHSAWYSTASYSDSEYWSKAGIQVAAALKGEWPLYAVNLDVKQIWLQRYGK
jgi:D-3-phosphoglycerate dehydrogenase